MSEVSGAKAIIERLKATVRDAEIPGGRSPMIREVLAGMKAVQDSFPITDDNAELYLAVTVYAAALQQKGAILHPAPLPAAELQKLKGEVITALDELEAALPKG